MPGPTRFRHELVDAAVFVNKIVRGDCGGGVGEALARGLAASHTGVVQQQDVDRRRARVVIGRGFRACWFEIGNERHGSISTPGLSRPCGSSAFLAARSASANKGG